MKPTPASRKQQVLTRLREGPARMSELTQLTGVKKTSVASIISRLRDDKFFIAAETTETSGDPRYRLLAEPDEILQ